MRLTKEWLRELFDNPGIAEQLPTNQLAEVVAAVKEYAAGLRPRELKYASPAETALALSEGDWYMADHLALLDEKIVQLVNGQLPRPDGTLGAKILVVEMPPRHGKSQLCSVWTPTWFLHRDPKAEVILASYEETFATKWGRKVRRLVLQLGEVLGLRLDRSTTAAGEWAVLEGGGMTCRGAGGAIVGRGADLFIIDDPHKNAEEARSTTNQEKMWDWFQTVALSRLSPTGVMIIIATRWHENDLIGQVLKAQQDEKLSHLGVHEIRLPALAEADDPLGRDVDEPLWPERYDKAAMLALKAANAGYNWSAIYQQRPSPEEGMVILRTWWRKYQVAPAVFDDLIASWDFTFKGEKRNDYVVGSIWGRLGAQFYLLYLIRGRMAFTEALAAFRNTCQLWPKAAAKLIEDAANGPAVVSTVQHEIPGVVLWPPRVSQQKGRQKKTDSKMERVVSATPYIQAGNVFLPENPAAWSGSSPEEFVEELAAFPNGANDDQVDVTTQAILYLRHGAWGVVDRDHATALRGLPQKTTQELHNEHMKKLLEDKIAESDKRIKQHQIGTGFMPRFTNQY